MIRRAQRTGIYRSRFESTLAEQLEESGVDYEYEPRDGRIEYTVPGKAHKYNPDFVLGNGVIVEGKGRFTAEDRRKHLLIKEQRPDLDIRFVFQRSASPLFKGSKTTYADWCRKNGFLFADKTIPAAWMRSRRKPKPRKPLK